MLKIKNKKKLVITLLAALTLSVAVIPTIYHMRSKQKPTVVSINGQKINLTPATADDNKEINDKKMNGTLDRPTTTPTADNVGASISRANQSLDGTLQVRVLVSSLTTGSCKLTMTNKNSTVSRNSSIVNKNTYYGCDGFDITPADFSAGEWTIQVSVTDGNLKGSATQVVTLTK